MVGFEPPSGERHAQGRVSDDPSSPATGSESPTTSASGRGASGSSRERSSGCSSGVDPDSPDVGRRDRTGSGPYGRSADEGVWPASLGGVEGCMASLSGINTSCLVGLSAATDASRSRRDASRSRRRRDTVERCLGDVPARRSSIVSLFAGDSRGLRPGTRCTSCCGSGGAFRVVDAGTARATVSPVTPPSARQLLAITAMMLRRRVIRSGHRSGDRHELPELEDRGVGKPDAAVGRLGG